MTVAELSTVLREFEKEARRTNLDDVRARYREERGLVYVKQFTVAAHFRPYRRRVRAVTSKRRAA